MGKPRTNKVTLAQSRALYNPRLTGREHEVALFLAVGMSNREIANAMDISIKTVDTHRGHVLAKLKCRNNVALARYAIRVGAIGLDDEHPMLMQRMPQPELDAAEGVSAETLDPAATGELENASAA